MQIVTHTRHLRPSDVPAAMKIERQSFEYPWREEEFIRCVRQRNTIGMVAEQNDRVAGFVIYELHKHRIHIVNLAVSCEARRTGVGRTLCSRLFGKLSHDRRNRILAEVRETNLAAQFFFRSVGFRAISVLRDFYDDCNEDAYLFQVRYKEPAVSSPRISGALPASGCDG